MAKKKCPACGKKIAQEATYCIYCRTWLEKSKDQRMRDAIVEETLTTLMEDGYDSALHIAQEEDQSIDAFATRQMDAVTEETVEAATASTSTMVMEAVEEPEISDTKRRHRKGKKSEPTQGKVWLFVSIAAFLMIAFVFVLLVVRAARTAQERPVSDDPATTTTTRSAQHDEWLQTFVGEWVDETSRGKKDLQLLGGHGLYVHEIVGDTVIFDVYSYSNAKQDHTAYVMNVHAKLNDDVLHFTFMDDACGHSGEGFMRFCDAGIETEIRVDNAHLLSNQENSLAINALFVRRELPHSDGVDLIGLKTLSDIKAVAGEPTAPPKADKTTKMTTYVFGALTANVKADNTVDSLTVDFSKLENKAAYCYDSVDGTMGYDTVKMYFGEAVHDYLEQPTNIRVLHYLIDQDSAVTFTFDSASQLLLRIKFDT